MNGLIADRQTDGRLENAARTAPRDALNGLQKANFFRVEQDDPVVVVDRVGLGPEFTAAASVDDVAACVAVALEDE